MLDPTNVSSVLSNEESFCALPEDLRLKILAVIPDVLAMIDVLETELVSQTSLLRASIAYTQVCLDKNFIPISEEVLNKALEAVDSALEMMKDTAEEAQEHDVVVSDIPERFGMNYSPTITLPTSLDDSEDDNPDSEEEAEDDLDTIIGDLDGIGDALIEVFQDKPISQQLIARMSPSVRSAFEAGTLTIGKMLEQQPSLVFVVTD
ncbi:hypothetical protein KBA63_04820 [Candidatus Woesebacteria bacterium]|nr:hypothetical protein [Candidatus Woesebacteria bacterium]MBP9687162.1 hypothetical protein [Candidatus Woesebacteria bacterium]